MFNTSTLPLSRFADTHGLEIVRDCDFTFIGKTRSRVEPRVVPCGKRKHIEEAVTAGGVAGIITTADLASDVPDGIGAAVADHPLRAAYSIHDDLVDLPGFHWTSFASRVDPAATVHPSAIVDSRDVVIGAGTVVHAGAIVCKRSIIGENCSIGPGAVVGTDAFEVDTTRQPHRVLKQAGGVMLGDNVEIQAKCTIVRATFGGFTTLGDETKLDCQVHLAHDCRVGRRTRIAACAELSGRVTVGDDVFIGPNVSISNGVAVHNGATVTIGAVVIRDVPAGERVTGNFALPHTQWLRFIRSIRR
jgi:UDP-3-O-[3-hydroxymyristoyl] glucosamine N-acyltransferase